MARLDLAKARKLGLPDEAIQKYAQSKGISLYDSSQAQVQPQQQGFNLADLLPIAGAIGGSFLPGLGTIAGGALGAGTGTLLRQGVKQQPLNVGEAGKEALFAGAGGAIGGKLLGPLFGKLGAAGTRAATIAPKSGIAQFGRQEAIRKTASLFPKLRGGGTTKFQNVEKVIDDLENQVGDLFQGVKTTIPSQTFGQRASAIESTMSPGDARAFRNIYNRTLRSILGDKPPPSLNANQVNAIKRSFNKQASAAYRSVERGGVLSAPNQAVIELRDFTDDILTQLAPQETKAGVNLLNQQMKDLIEGIPEFKSLSEQGLNFFGLRPPGAGILPGAVQTGQDIIGRTAGKLAPQAERIGAGAGAALGGQPQLPTEGLPETLTPVSQAQATQPGQNIIKMLAIQDLAQTGGKNLAKIKAFGEIMGIGGTVGSSEEFLNKATQTIGQIKARSKRAYGPIQGRLYEAQFRLAGGAGVPKEAVELNQLNTVLKLNILRAYQGARISDKDFELAQLYIPNLSDTDQVARTKVQVLEDLLTNAQPPTTQTGGSIPFPSNFSNLGL